MIVIDRASIRFRKCDRSFSPVKIWVSTANCPDRLVEIDSAGRSRCKPLLIDVLGETGIVTELASLASTVISFFFNEDRLVDGDVAAAVRTRYCHMRCHGR